MYLVCKARDLPPWGSKGQSLRSRETLGPSKAAEGEGGGQEASVLTSPILGPLTPTSPSRER